VPDKQKCEAFYGHKKLWWSEAWKRSDLAERNPEPPPSGEAYTTLLYDEKAVE